MCPKVIALLTQSWGRVLVALPKPLSFIIPASGRNAASWCGLVWMDCGPLPLNPLAICRCCRRLGEPPGHFPHPFSTSSFSPATRASLCICRVKIWLSSTLKTFLPTWTVQSRNRMRCRSHDQPLPRGRETGNQRQRSASSAAAEHTEPVWNVESGRFAAT